MGRNAKWTDELKKEMFSFFKEAEKKGNQTILETAEKFSKMHEDITPSQVKSAYYKFSEMQKKAALNTDAWTEEEDVELLNNANNRKGTLTAVFDDFAKNHRRPASNVSQHYYYLLRHGKDKKIEQKINKEKHSATAKIDNNEKSKAQIIKVKRNHTEVDVNSLIKNIKKMPKETLASISHIVELINNQ